MTAPTDKPSRPTGMDAKEWAAFWLQTIKDHPGVPMDEGAMIGWFANVAMAGFDESSRRSDAERASLQQRVAELEAGREGFAREVGWLSIEYYDGPATTEYAIDRAIAAVKSREGK